MPRTPFFYGWVIVAAAVIIGFLTTGLSGYANGILLPELADELANGSRGQIAIGFSMATVFGTIFAPFIGRYADNYSPSKIILIGAVLLAVSYAMLASATELWHLYVAKGIVYAVGIQMAGPIVRNLVVAHWFDRFRGRALGFSVMGASIAGVVLPLVLNELVNMYGWRTTVYLFAIVVFGVLVPVTMFILRDKPADIGEIRDGRQNQGDTVEESAKVAADNAEPWSWAQLLRSRSLWACGLTFGPMVCVYIVMMVHLFGHVVDSGLEKSQAAMILSVLAFTSIVGKPIIGTMADKFGARITLWISLAAQATAMVGFVMADSFVTFAIAAMIHGVGYAAVSSIRTYALSRAFGIKSLGSSMGLLRWIELPFASVASPLAGFIYDATGSYDNALLILAVFLTIAGVGPFFIDNKNSSGAKETAPK